ncbi:MAG: circadian clock protein KaiC [Chloroflexota bacterium]
MIDLSNVQPLTKIPTGIEGVEHLTIGGLPASRTTLLAGSSGSGKTIFATEFLYRGIVQFKQPGLFITFEERATDIIRNVKRFGWHLDTLVEQGQLAFIDGSPEIVPTEETGEYDLAGLLTQIEYTIKAQGVKQVVMDSIGSLFHQFRTPALIRREIFRITEALKSLNVTTIMTVERLEEYGPITRYGIEEFVSDNVIVLRNVLQREKVRRTIQVLKVRGDTHMKGEYPFTISETGLTILPLSAIELQQESSNERVSTGNDQLDAMTSGGIFRDSIFLVSGPTGGGKTLMSTMFTAEACRRNERVLLLAYEESREQLLRNAKSWGVDFRQWEADGLLRIVCQYPETMGLEDHLLTIRRQISQFQPHRLVMDSVSAMERVAGTRTFREFVIGLTSYVKQERICSLLTSTTPQLSGGESVTEAHISTITDVIALLRYVEINGVLRRGIAVIKMRGSQHEKQVREYTIDSQGLNIEGPFKNVDNIILGVPTRNEPSETDQLGDMFA